MKYQAVIFDLDGVITHSDQYHYLAWKQLADKLGIPFDETINRRLRGVSRMQSLEIILEACPRVFTREEKLRYADEKNELYRQMLLQNMSPQDLSVEVKKTLEQIRNQGILMAIGSSSKNAGLILTQIGLEHFFDAVVDGTQITHSKPDPEVFQTAGEALKQVPAACLVVEDAQSGIQAALAAGMDCAAIGDAATYDLATYRLHRFSDLLSILS